MTEPRPPRALEPGMIIAQQHRVLGWSLAQVIYLQPEGRGVGIVDLEWFGPELLPLNEIGPLAPVRGARDALREVQWVLPKSATVVGSRPLVVDGPAWTYTNHWDIGGCLFRRMIDDGLLPPEPTHTRRILGEDPCNLTVTGDASGLSVYVRDFDTLDCRELTVEFPEVRTLFLSGHPSILREAGSLNQLPNLASITLFGLCGFGAAEVLDPCALPVLEDISLWDVPIDFVQEMRRRWKNAPKAGTYLFVRGARKPEWFEMALTNPLASWSGAGGIRGAIFRPASRILTRLDEGLGAVPAGLCAQETATALVDLGRRFALAFNKLDAGGGFIETAERDDILDAAAIILGRHRAALNHPDPEQALLHAVNEARTW